MSSESKDEKENPVLKSSKVEAFWQKHFKDQTKVNNSQFQEALMVLFEEQKGEGDELSYNKDKQSQQAFAKRMVEQIFWPATNLKEPLNPEFVDKSCIQFAMNTFGPWSTLFQTISANLEDPSLPHEPLRYFHGRIPKEKFDVKFKEVGNFGLRYNDKAPGLLLVTGTQTLDTSTVRIKDEALARRRLVKTTGKKKKKKLSELFGHTMKEPQ